MTIRCAGYLLNGSGGSQTCFTAMYRSEAGTAEVATGRYGLVRGADGSKSYVFEGKTKLGLLLNAQFMPTAVP